MNVVVVGHVDHGKSTLIGRLLYDSAAIPEENIAEMQKLIEEYKKRFEFAYFVDSFEEELQKECTIDTTQVLFKGDNYYTIIDVPGHKEFIKNMLTGAASAQVAILVVSCVDRIKEQTRRHSFLINMLGIKDIIVAINKMDLVDYDESVFNRTKEKVSQMLASLGYNQCQFIPVSATEGDNVYQPSFLTAWYRGSTLIKALDNLESATVIDKPLRFVVQGAYSVNGEEITMGRVESGVLRKGERLLFQPSGISATVCSIRVFPGELNEARAGDSIGVLNDRDVLRGDVGGHINEPPSVATDFLGKVVLLEGTLHKHDELEIRCGTKKVQCKVKEIRERISSETGEVISRNAREIKENEAAVAVFHTEPIVIEKFSEIPELGRFILVRDGKNIGAGIILER